MSPPVGIRDVLAARARILSRVRWTPLERSDALSRATAAEVYLKHEGLQVTGSVKARGALNRLATLSTEERCRGVIAPTAGNHGIALAHAGRELDIPVPVYLPETADPLKVETLRALGARLCFFESIEAARRAALVEAGRQELTFVSAYNDRHMIAGSGTVALEILDDLPEVDLVVTGVGGGGMAAGLGTVLEAVAPGSELWGVQMENSPTLARWHEAGRVVPVELRPSIAEGLSGPIDPGTITFPIVRRTVRRMLTVSEAQLAGAVRWLLEQHQLVVEPSGAAGLAAALARGAELRGRRVVVVLSGRNVARERLRGTIDLSLASERDARSTAGVSA